MGFHLLHHHNDDDDLKGVPKGCMAIMVGHEGEEQLQRFVIPVMYVNHPLFLQLLKEAEEEYGFDHHGPLILPCHVEQFRSVQGLIDQDNHNHHHHHHHHHSSPAAVHPHRLLCFKA